MNNDVSKVVKIGYAEYMDEHGELTVLRRVELRVHVYKEERIDFEPPFWSVAKYRNEEGIERSGKEYFRDFESADWQFIDRSHLGMYTIGKKCPNCSNMEVMNKFRIGVLYCMNCGHEWKK